MAGRSSSSAVPTASVPVTAKIDGVGWHGNNMTNATFDVAVAAGAEVSLDSLVRLYKRGVSVGPIVDGGSLRHAHPVCRARQWPRAL